MAGSTGRGAITWAVFAFALSVVVISSVPIAFPASLTLSDPPVAGMGHAGPERFESGAWAAPLVITNATVFGLAFLHFSGRIPALSRLFVHLFSFEVSRRAAVVVVSVILVMYVAASAGELESEDTWGDYAGIKERLESWPPHNLAESVAYEPHVKYAITVASMQVFGNYAVLPFVASILLVILTYLITVQITAKRFAGIVAMVLLLQSNVFLSYDTSVTYTNFWACLYLASLYLARGMWWGAAPVAFVMSIPAKALTAVFAPMSVYYYMRADIPRSHRAAICCATVAVVVAAAAVAVFSSPVGSAAGLGEEFDAAEFWMGFSSFANQLRFDGIVLMFSIPLIVGLFVASRSGTRHADSVMVMIAGMLLAAPILTGFSTQTNQPYRFVPLVVFFSIGVGVLLSGRPLPSMRGAQRSR